MDKATSQKKQTLILIIGIAVGLIIWSGLLVSFLHIRADIRAEVDVMIEQAEQDTADLADKINRFDAGQLEINDLEEEMCEYWQRVNPALEANLEALQKHNHYLLRITAKDKLALAAVERVDWLELIPRYQEISRAEAHKLEDPPLPGTCLRARYDRNQQLLEEWNSSLD